MAKKAETKKQKALPQEPEKKGTSFFDYLRFGESYTSLILGIIVVIVATALLLSFVHNKNAGSANTPTSEQTQNTIQISQSAKNLVKRVPTKTPKLKNSKDNNIWVVQKGESLWVIAERKYTSGYNWVDIARENNLSDPSDIHVGDRLALPQVTPKASTIVREKPTVETNDNQFSSTMRTNEITRNTYTVVKGDSLWNIAVRAYGDGYRWTDIAKANNLANPSMIFSGNHLKIPRN